MACAPQDPQAALNQTLTAYVAESLLSHRSSFTGNLGPLRLRLCAGPCSSLVQLFPVLGADYFCRFRSPS